MTKVNLSAEHWQLYSDMKGAGRVAQRLNKALNNVFKRDVSPQTAYAEWEKVARQYSSFGAWDTEPCSVAAKLIKEHYYIDGFVSL